MNNDFLKDPRFQETFKASLIEGKQWCGETKIKWAEVKTLDLSKAVVVFNLGVMAFIGAMSSSFSIQWILFVVAGLLIISILLAFIYVWKVSVENINYLQAKYDTIVEALQKSEINFIGAFLHYEKHMSFIEGKLRGKEKCWDTIQVTSFVLFFLGIIILLIGLIT